jgi:hypothetical protein
VPDSIVDRLEERLGEPVDRHVQEAARAPAPGVSEDEERIDRPADQAIGEETLARGEA